MLSWFDELKLLTDTFHLPHKIGDKCIELIEKIKTNNFEEIAQQSYDLLHKLASLKNRDLYHSIYPFAWELYAMIKKYRLGNNVEFLPKTKRGTISSHLDNV